MKKLLFYIAGSLVGWGFGHVIIFSNYEAGIFAMLALIALLKLEELRVKSDSITQYNVDTKLRIK